MSYKALYRKWRPLVFEDVVEQQHIVKTLKYSVSTERIAHAYLFCGTRGTGKTTMAHILSRAINCLNPANGNPCNQCEICKGILSGSILDVLEIDAASNNSVDNVREIRDEVIYTPSHAKYKVYIIDEVHMLSSGAFNALLKTLEEPPQHVVFILATTEPHKLPVTVLSRCQKFEFRRISAEGITLRLNKIADAHGIILKEEASKLISRMSDGALRDAISLLDQCISLGEKKITYENVLSIAGIVNDSFVSGFVMAVNNKKIEELFTLVDRLIMDGKDIVNFLSDLIFYYRNLLVCKISKNPDEVVEVSKEALDTMIKQSKDISQEEIIYIIRELSSAESDMKRSAHPRILFEVSLVKICEGYLASDNGDVMDRLAAIERKISKGTINMQTSDEKPEKIQLAPIKPEINVHKDVRAKNPGKAEKLPHNVKNLSTWPKFINELKNMGRMTLYTNLLGTKAVQLNNGALGILFSPDKKFNKTVVSKAENIEVLKTLASKNFGREITVRCIDEEDYMPESNIKDVENDDFLNRARPFTEKAEKLDVPVTIIDE